MGNGPGYSYGASYFVPIAKYVHKRLILLMGINTVGAIHESPANFAEYDIVERKNEYGYNSKAGKGAVG